MLPGPLRAPRRRTAAARLRLAAGWPRRNPTAPGPGPAVLGLRFLCSVPSPRAPNTASPPVALCRPSAPYIPSTLPPTPKIPYSNTPPHPFPLQNPFQLCPIPTGCVLHQRLLYPQFLRDSGSA